MTSPSIGVDVILLRRMRDALETTGKVFVDHVFTQREQEAAARHADRIAYFATRFAAKEAVFKTLGIDWTGVAYTDIEIVEGPHGEPCIVLHGRLADLAAERHTRVAVSVSYDGGEAIGVALLSGV